MRIIAGTARGKRIEPPSDRTTRPALDSTREAIFNILADQVEGCRVLDLFAGVGAFGLEALSRGARSATFVDQSMKAIEILERNVDSLNFKYQTTVLCGDALLLPELKTVETAFGLIFMDPPFPFFGDEQLTELMFQRVAALLRSNATNEQSEIILRLPKIYRDPVPFPSARERKYGKSRMVFLKRSDLKPEL